MTIGTDGVSFTCAQQTNYTDIPTSAQKIEEMLPARPSGANATQKTRLPVEQSRRLPFCPARL